MLGRLSRLGPLAPGFVAEQFARGGLMSLEELRNPNTDGSLCSVTSDRHHVRFLVPVEPGIVGAFHVRVPRATRAPQPEATPQAGVPEERHNRRDH